MNQEIINDPVLDDLIGRRDDEPPQAYSAFVFFGGLPEAERHAPDVNVKCAAHVSTTVDDIKFWRKEYEWDSRASLVDAYGYKLSFSHTLQLLKEDDRLFVQHNREFKEKILEARRLLLDTLIEQIGAAKDMTWKPSDLASLYNALTRQDKNFSLNPTSLMDTLTTQRTKIQGMDDDEFQKLYEETQRQEQLQLIEGVEQ